MMIALLIMCLDLFLVRFLPTLRTVEGIGFFVIEAKSKCFFLPLHTMIWAYCIGDAVHFDPYS